MKRHPFTLVELIVSMAVFALLSMMVVRLFSASQRLWVSTNQKSEMSAEGRMALDFISNLLMSSTANPLYNGTRVGSDYLELDQNGEGISATSRLFFVTRSDLKALVGSSTPDVATCFVGIQVVKIDQSGDPDDQCYVLVASTKTYNDGNNFSRRFPDNTSGSPSIKNDLDEGTDAAFSDIVSNQQYKVSRIATNVVDFQVRVYATTTEETGTGSKKTTVTTNASEKIASGEDKDVSKKFETSSNSKPTAVEITLTLMDRRHYEDYLDNVDQRDTLRNQFGRTFRRIVWLDGGVRARDISEDWE